MARCVRAVVVVIMISVALLTAQRSLAEVKTVDFGGLTWSQIKGKHFIVYFYPNGDVNEARGVLSAAEHYYKTIGDAVGFTRYSDFWTWEQRAKIFIFPDQQHYTQITGAPAWSKGYADRDSFMFQSRAIVTYSQEEALRDELLPHEISHLILHDFISEEYLPVWIDEGVAQLYEKDKFQIVDRMMRSLLQKGQHISFDFFNRWDIRREKDAQKIEIFYAQSLSVIRFLREKHGAENFRRFFRNLRDGKTVEEALRSAYPTYFRSLDDLEQRWMQYMKH